MWVHVLQLLEAIATAAACVVILEAGYRYATRRSAPESRRRLRT